jgi:uncharacterized membrane protein
MSNLIVVGFKKDMFRASRVLSELVAMNEDWVVDLQDAVAAYRDYNGNLRLDQSYQMTTGEGAAWGGLWGSLVGLTIGAIAAPVTAGASAVAGALGGGALGAAGGAIDADWWKQDYGISEDFVRDVGAMVQPGDSAIFALLRFADPNVLAERFRGYGGTVMQSTLTKEQADKVQAVLEGKR